MMSWQNVVIFVALLAAVLVAPRLGADPQMVGVVTTIGAGFFVRPKSDVAGP